jgi:hypothetical protein
MSSREAPWLKIDPERRSVSINSTDPGFYNDPYAAYERIRPVIGRSSACGAS